jgi:phosphate transport system ATP-binding protein
MPALHLPALRIRDLRIAYGTHTALRGVSLDVPHHRIVAFIGPSGSGKSTLLRALNRMHDVTALTKVTGEVLFDDANILDTDTDVIALRQRIGMVFQNPTPFPTSIYKNVSYGLEIQGKRSKRLWASLLHRPIDPVELERSDDPVDQAVFRSLNEASLWEEVKHRLHLSAMRLSGGQQQRLCIARAIAVRPEILLLDEPCSDLDPISTKAIEQLLLRLKEHYTIIIVTHNLHQARRIADEVAFFHAGELVEHGHAQELFGAAKHDLTKEYVAGGFG